MRYPELILAIVGFELEPKPECEVGLKSVVEVEIKELEESVRDEEISEDSMLAEEDAVVRVVGEEREGEGDADGEGGESEPFIERGVLALLMDPYVWVYRIVFLSSFLL